MVQTAPVTLSGEQDLVVDTLVNTNSNICVQATAGAGKTFTLLQLLNHIPRFKRGIFLSFSNGIVDELKSRIPVGVQASTLHSFGCRLLMKAYGGLVVEEEKYFIRALATYYPDKSSRTKEAYRDCYRIKDITNFIRMTLVEQKIQPIKEMCEYYSLEYTEDLIMKSIDLIQPEKHVKMIDFTDMLYLPVTNPTIVTQFFDYVFLDEAQDCNNCQVKFVELLLGTRGRLIAVGDSFQAIYSFAGSSIDSFEKLQARPNTVTLKLTETRRCSQAVVRRARKICDLIVAHSDNPEGEERKGTLSEIREGDLVVSRTTRPLVSLYFYLLEQDIKATIVGKDIESGLIALATKCKSYHKDGILRNLQGQLRQLGDELREVGIKIVADNPKYISLVERVQVLTLILRKVERPDQLVAKIKEIFSEQKKAVKLMTLHRAKGLENERVFLIERYNKEKMLPFKYATKPWELLQERNLEFVGCTRAKNDLIFLDYSDE